MWSSPWIPCWKETWRESKAWVFQYSIFTSASKAQFVLSSKILVVLVSERRSEHFQHRKCCWKVIIRRNTPTHIVSLTEKQDEMLSGRLGWGGWSVLSLGSTPVDPPLRSTRYCLVVLAGNTHATTFSAFLGVISHVVCLKVSCVKFQCSVMEIVSAKMWFENDSSLSKSTFNLNFIFSLLRILRSHLTKLGKIMRRSCKCVFFIGFFCLFVFCYCFKCSKKKNN